MSAGKVGTIVKNGGQEKFAIPAGSIAARYGQRLSRFVAFQQTCHESKAKQERKGRIFPLTSRLASRCRRLFFLFRPGNNSAPLELRGKSARLRISLRFSTPVQRYRPAFV